MKTIRIGLFGYGVVGAGFDQLVSRTGAAVISKVAVKHPFLHPELSAERLVANRYDILYDENIDLVVEAIDDADAAFEILKIALQHGKPVVSANKQMIARHLPEIIRLQKRFHTPVLYEAACCAGIPVIRTLQDYFRPELSRRFRGIINGSTNYILTAMSQYRFRFAHALQLAQEAGFAETDASLDVEGIDAANKLSIIIRHLWGTYVAPDKITYTGIQNVLPQDLRLSEQVQGVVKLVAETSRRADGSIHAFILPRLLLKGNALYHTAHEYNGIVLEDEAGNEQFLSGKGSGAAPTAYGLWADVQALQSGYRYAYRSPVAAAPAPANALMTVHVSVPDTQLLPAVLEEALFEYAADSRYRYYSGRITPDGLSQDNWWKQDGISLMDISELDQGGAADLQEKLETLVALQADIFQPV